MNEAKIFGLRRSMPFPATMLAVLALLVAVNRPHGGRLGVAVAVAVVMATWLVGSWRSVRFTIRHLTADDAFWQAHNRRSRRLTLWFGVAVTAATVVVEAYALSRSDWLVATATLGPLFAALFPLAALGDVRMRRSV